MLITHCDSARVAPNSLRSVGNAILTIVESRMIMNRPNMTVIKIRHFCSKPLGVASRLSSVFITLLTSRIALASQVPALAIPGVASHLPAGTSLSDYQYRCRLTGGPEPIHLPIRPGRE